MVGFPSLPFLVVIRITPFADLAPNTAAELASFKMSIVLISFGLISSIAPVKITPSNTMSGLELAVKVPRPLTNNLELEPLVVASKPTSSPGALPRNIS